ncbi:MAG: hypothetical protein GY930_00685 [bacterium]|nr:hypothetical protein [bacterium]
MIPIDKLIRRVNRFLIGWRGYFEHGYPYRTFRKLDRHAYSAVYNHLRKRSQRRFKPPKGCSYYELIYKRMGLIRLAAKGSR